ncbi:hypothetical protein ACFQYP_00810 [Nonomuraea antimicrobica]
MEVREEFSMRCLPSRIDYAASLIDENDGGYLAVFEVLDDGERLLSQRRRKVKRLR